MCETNRTSAQLLTKNERKKMTECGFWAVVYAIGGIRRGKNEAVDGKGDLWELDYLRLCKKNKKPAKTIQAI